MWSYQPDVYNLNRFINIDMDMAGRHKARADTIHIVRTAVIPTNKLRRADTKTFSQGAVKFPILNKISRAPIRKFKKIAYARRPALFQ